MRHIGLILILAVMLLAAALFGRPSAWGAFVGYFGPNTYFGNPTSTNGAQGAATAVASCSAAHDASQYTTNTGFTCATDIADLDQENSFTKHQEPVPVALVDGSSITVTGTDANLYTLTVAGNSHTLACPSTIRKGTYNFRILNSGGATGFATASCYKYPGGTAPTWSTTNGFYDVLSCSAFDTSRLECNALTNLQ